MIRRILLMATVALVMVATMALSALPALAIPPHEHFLTPANGEEIAVGPQVCTHPQTLTGFGQFHLNVPGSLPKEQPRKLQGDGLLMDP